MWLALMKTIGLGLTLPNVPFLATHASRFLQGDFYCFAFKKEVMFVFFCM